MKSAWHLKPKVPGTSLWKCLALLLLLLAWAGPACAGELPAGGLSQEARAYREDGLKAQQSGDVHNAIAKYQKAVLLDPSYATAYNDLGISHEALGQLPEAKQAYLHCLDIDPQYVSAYTNLAMLHERQGDFGTALVYWQRRAEMGTPSDPWTGKAKERIAELMSKRSTEELTPLAAEQTSAGSSPARRSLELPAAPRQVQPGASLRKSSAELEIDVGRLSQELGKTYYDLGVAYTKLKAYPKAVAAFERALAHDPMHAQSHAHLGLLYKHVQNDPQKASRHLQTYLQLTPNATDREELEALIALLQRTQVPQHRPAMPDGSAWGLQ